MCIRDSSLDELPRVVQKQTQLIKQERDMGRRTMSQLCVLCDDNLGNMRFNKHLDGFKLADILRDGVREEVEPLMLK